MPSFGKTSKNKLAQAHPLLQEVFEAVVKEYDCSIIEGRRDKETQDRYYAEGKSKLKYPESKHNHSPSLAVDAVPYPIDWNDTKRFYYFAGLVIATAKSRSFLWP